MMVRELKAGMVVKSDTGEWLLIIHINRNIVTVDSIGKYEHRTHIHRSHLLTHTAHMLKNPKKYEYA